MTLPPSLGPLRSKVALTLGGSSISLCLLALANVLIGRMIGPDGVGLVATATLIPMVIVYLGELGLPAATGYQLNAGDHSAVRTAAVARSCALALALALTSLSLTLSFVLPINPVRPLTQFYSAFIVMHLFYRTQMAILQANFRLIAYNSVRVAGCVAYLGVIVALYLLEMATPLLILVALLAGNLVWLGLSSLLTFSVPYFAVDKLLLKGLVGYGARVHLGNVSAIDGLRLDQLVLAFFLPPKQLGLYVAVMTVITANRMIGISIGLICFPIAASRKNSNATEANRHFRNLFTLAFILSLLVAAIEFWSAGWLPVFLFGPAFSEAEVALRVLAIASIFMNLRQVAAEWLRGIGMPGVVALTEVTSIIILGLSAAALWDGTPVPVAWSVAIASASSLVALACGANVGGKRITQRSMQDVSGTLVTTES